MDLDEREELQELTVPIKIMSFTMFKNIEKPKQRREGQLNKQIEDLEINLKTKKKL